ncbi:hypothetical protein C0J52_25722 [Blattella germanica]|nr:hypothetical protein C0J52_25722 [Blattella germanica]
MSCAESLAPETADLPQPLGAVHSNHFGTTGILVRESGKHRPAKRAETPNKSLRRLGQLLGVLALISTSTAQHYPQQYEVHDDSESPESSSGASSSSKGPDYSKYYAAGTSSDGQTAGADESGFVRPIDFSTFFGAGNIGFGGDAAGTAQVFRPANTELNTFTIPLSQSGSVFPDDIQGSATTKNNDKGFTSPQVKFASLFDASGSASEVGFRPQDFLKNAAPNDDDRISQGTTVTGSSGYYSPSFGKLDADYNVGPGPHYVHHTVPAAAEQHPKKSAYKPESESDEDDESSEYSPSSSEDRYEEKPTYKPKPTDSYSFKPSTFKSNKPEYAEGKSSYPSPTEKYAYKPLYSSPAPEQYKPKPQLKTSSANTGKSAYLPSAGFSSKPSQYGLQKEKSAFPSSAPLDIYGTPTAYTSLPTEQREGKTRYSTPIDGDIIYGKGKAPTFQPLPSEPHQGKSSYPASFPKDIYNDKFVAKPSPTQQSKFYGSSASPYIARSTPYPKVISTTAGSPSDREETYQGEPAGHGPPDYTPSGTATDKKKCKKIQKRLTADDVSKGRFRRDAMTCYQCEDPKTGGTFEKCSYTSDPNSKSYFVGHAQKYSTDTATKPKTYRYRRYLSNDPLGLESEEEELVTAETRSRVARQDTGFEYTSSDDNGKGDYRFGPEYFTSSSSDDVSEYKPAESNIDKKHCQKVTKDSMICMVCKDPKTGGTYEQCSYSEKPKKNNYFVAHETSIQSGKKKPYTETHTYEAPEETSYIPHSRHIRQEPKADFKKIRPKTSDTRSKIEEKYGIPLELSASSKRETTSDGKGGVGLDPYLYGQPEPYDPKATEKNAEGTEQQDSYFPGGKSYEEYFRHLFPELHEEGKGSASSDTESYEYPSSANTKSERTVPGFEYQASVPDYFTDTEQKKDLEKVLGEFTQKDRTSCKKVMKDKMTCYKCIDSKGMQHEECMFVAASEPKSSHLAYHEVKEFRLVPTPAEADGTGSASSSLPVDSISSSSSDSTKTTQTTDKTTTDATTTITPKPRRKTFFKKVTTTTPTPVADNKFAETSQGDILKVSQKPSSDKQGVNVKVSRRSSKTFVTSTTTTLTTPPPPVKKVKSAKISASLDAEPAGSEVQEKKVTKSDKQYPEPELSASDLSPDGYYTAETKVKYDPILKVHLPEYMLTRSEHEAIFDEVMASGRRR